MKKQILSFVAWAMLFSLSSCMYDDADFNNRLDSLEERVKSLEDLCSSINNDMSALQTIVNALQNHITITEVQELSDGYTIHFSNGRTAQISNGAKGDAGKDGKDGKDGTNGKDGKDGKDGYTPVIGTAIDEEGIYCWTVDGQWLLDAEGNRIHVTGDKGADGRDGLDGKDGKDGTSSIVSVKEYADRRYYWTINGEFLLDSNGNMIPATGEKGQDGTSSVVGMALYSDHNYYWTINGEWLLDNLGNMVRVTGNDGKDGRDGKDGVDGTSSVIGIRQHTDGIYYWTLNGDWLLDGKGNKIKAAGADGQDGQDGKDGTSPVIQIRKDSDGYYYWTLNGQWLLDGDGKKVRVTGNDGKNGTNGTNGKDGTNGTNGTNGKDGVTPKLKIEYDYWYVSYDNGATWTVLGYARGSNGTDGTNGTNGKDGVSYVVAIQQDVDGFYYWTLNGDWMLDGMGQKIRVTGNDGRDGKDGTDGVTPQLKIKDDYWYITYDNGVTWTQLGKARGEDGTNGTDGRDGVDAVFHSVTQDDNNVYFTLADGVTVFTVPKANAGSIVERIKSVSYVPEHSDGWAKVSHSAGKRDGTVSLDFLISPKQAVSDIIGNWDSMLSLKVTYAATRSVSFIDLPILDVSADAANGVLTITASCSYLDDEFYSGFKNASAYLTIADSKTEVSSDVASITTINEDIVNIINGHEYVDLGLPSGTLWAIRNIGASCPEESGDSFAWGETSPKASYSLSNYKFWDNAQGIFTKYNRNYDLGPLDNYTSLESCDDAATVNWGNLWRMPTLDEWNELRTNCTYKTTTQNGILGLLIESLTNGNSIFFPAIHFSGTYWGGEHYWLSTYEPDDTDTSNIYRIHCGAVDNNIIWSGWYDRYEDLYIRPVCHLKKD